MKKDTWKGHSYWKNVSIPIRFALIVIFFVVIFLLIYFDLIRYFAFGEKGIILLALIICTHLLIIIILIDRNIRKKEKKEKAEIQKIENNIFWKESKKK